MKVFIFSSYIGQEPETQCKHYTKCKSYIAALSAVVYTKQKEGRYTNDLTNFVNV